MPAPMDPLGGRTMTEIGYKLSSEEHRPADLVRTRAGRRKRLHLRR